MITNLVGHWVLNGPPAGMDVHEVWHTDADGTMHGTVYALAGRDTVRLEELRIVTAMDTMVYRARIPAGHREPIVFMATPSEEGLVFEDPLHDHPKRITYLSEPGDRLRVTISGVLNGEQQERSFAYHRITGSDAPVP